MSFVKICVFFLLCAEVKGQSVLQCYVCDDCDIVDDCFLESCPLTTITTTTTTRTTTPFYTPPTTPKSTTPYHSTSATSTTGLPSTISSPSPTTAITASTTTEEPTKDTAEPIASETTESVTEETVTTEISSSTSTATEETRQEAQLIGHSLGQTLGERDAVMHTPKISYHCYSIHAVENYKWKKKRGCVEVIENDSACRVLRKKFGCPTKNCKVCSSDECNSCCSLRSSLLVLVIVNVIGLLCNLM